MLLLTGCQAVRPDAVSGLGQKLAALRLAEGEDVARRKFRRCKNLLAVTASFVAPHGSGLENLRKAGFNSAIGQDHGGSIHPLNSDEQGKKLHNFRKQFQIHHGDTAQGVLVSGATYHPEVNGFYLRKDISELPENIVFSIGPEVNDIIESWDVREAGPYFFEWSTFCLSSKTRPQSSQFQKWKRYIIYMSKGVYDAGMGRWVIVDGQEFDKSASIPDIRRIIDGRAVGLKYYYEGNLLRDDDYKHLSPIENEQDAAAGNLNVAPWWARIQTGLRRTKSDELKIQDL